MRGMREEWNIVIIIWTGAEFLRMGGGLDERDN